MPTQNKLFSLSMPLPCAISYIYCVICSTFFYTVYYRYKVWRDYEF